VELLAEGGSGSHGVEVADVRTDEVIDIAPGVSCLQHGHIDDQLQGIEVRLGMAQSLPVVLIGGVLRRASFRAVSAATTLCRSFSHEEAHWGRP
jgi:hypothetical protein